MILLIIVAAVILIKFTIKYADLIDNFLSK
jgi:hypothetical protein